jgi:hypothetical protein
MRKLTALALVALAAVALEGCGHEHQTPSGSYHNVSAGWCYDHAEGRQVNYLAIHSGTGVPGLCIIHNEDGSLPDFPTPAS